MQKVENMSLSLIFLAKKIKNYYSILFRLFAPSRLPVSALNNLQYVLRVVFY